MSDDRGATIVEFAMVAPVMLLMILGLLELSYEAYVKAVLNGAMQKAGRDSTIKDSASIATAIDTGVMAQINSVAPQATGVSSRKSYEAFGYMDPEPFTDGNGNGIRDSGECFTDVNANGVWDADPGSNGQGGASDAVIYTMKVSYPRLFPLYGSMGWSATATATESTMLKNQPFASQATRTPVTVCK